MTMKPYQTEIGIIITPPVEVEIKEIINTYITALEGAIERLIPGNHLSIEFYQLDDEFYGEHSIVLNGVFTRWYIGNPSYDAIVLLLNWIENIGGSYHYLAVGDDYTDIEETVVGEPEGRIQLHRVMHW